MFISEYYYQSHTQKNVIYAKGGIHNQTTDSDLLNRREAVPVVLPAVRHFGGVTLAVGVCLRDAGRRRDEFAPFR